MAGTTPGARWARGVGVAAVTAPGVLTAQLLTTRAVASLWTVLVVSAVVAVVACAAPARGARGTAAVAALAQLAGHAVLIVTTPAQQVRSGCLSVVGRGADLGIRYALAHDSAACPPGTLPAGPALTAAAAAVTGAAVVLLGHAALATLTGALLAAAAAGLDVVRRLSVAVAPVLAELAGFRAAPMTLPAPPLPEPPVLRDRWRPGSALRRGPPLRLPAPA